MFAEVMLAQYFGDCYLIERKSILNQHVFSMRSCWDDLPRYDSFVLSRTSKEERALWNKVRRFVREASGDGYSRRAHEQD